MIGEVQSLLDQYWIWLRDRTSLREIGDWTEITTPYLDRHNDCTKEVRSPDSRAYAILNDSDQQVSENVLAAIRSYDVHPISWSTRDQAREELAA